MPLKKKSKIYSHSRLSTFEKCPMKFKFQYIDKIIPEVEQTIESHLGKSVHEVLEWFYTQVKKGKTPSIDEMILYYTYIWKENYAPETLIVKKYLTEKDYFNKGVQFLLNYYTENSPFDDNTLETEKRILINLDKDGAYKMQGFIDRLVYNAETGEYEIHDYKTANSMPSKEKINEDRQLAIYSIAIKELFGYDKDVCLIWHYLAHNQKICIRKANSELSKLKKDIIELIDSIESSKEFPAKKSALCSWCEYKNVCPEFGGTPPKKEIQKKFESIFSNNRKDSSDEVEEIIEISEKEKLDIW